MDISKENLKTTGLLLMVCFYAGQPWTYGRSVHWILGFVGILLITVIGQLFHPFHLKERSRGRGLPVLYSVGSASSTIRLGCFTERTDEPAETDLNTRIGLCRSEKRPGAPSHDPQHAPPILCGV
ncbi:MAG: hypothetical protein ACRD3D_01235 [Terriglobia bacterium]